MGKENMCMYVIHYILLKTDSSDIISLGFAHNPTIKQTPSLNAVRVGLEALLDCEQVTTDHNFMYWYHQRSNQELKLIAYLQRDEKPNYEDGRTELYEVGTKHGYKHSYLKIKSATSDVQGVYFCASSLAQ